MPRASSDGSEPDVLRRCPLWVRLVMIVSLSANLVVAGLLIGNRMREEPNSGLGNRPGAGNWIERRILSSLPEEKQPAAGAVFAERGPEMDELRQMRADLREQAAAILEAEDYDIDALLAVFDKRQLASSALFALYFERVAVLAADLTQAERIALSHGLLRRGHRPQH